MSTGKLGAIKASLVRRLPYSERGPRKNAVFALWMMVGASNGLVTEPAVTRRNHIKRVAMLKKRLSSLSLPPQIRKVVPAVLESLEGANKEAAARALNLLVSPTRDALGRECAELISRAAAVAAENDIQGA